MHVKSINSLFGEKSALALCLAATLFSSGRSAAECRSIPSATSQTLLLPCRGNDACVVQINAPPSYLVPFYASKWPAILDTPQIDTTNLMVTGSISNHPRGAGCGVSSESVATIAGYGPRGPQQPRYLITHHSVGPAGAACVASVDPKPVISIANPMLQNMHGLWSDKTGLFWVQNFQIGAAGLSLALIVARYPPRPGFGSVEGIHVCGSAVAAELFSPTN